MLNVVAQADARGITTRLADEGALDKIVDVATSQGVVAVAPFVHVPLSSVVPDGPVLVLHEVRDPGNVGTAIRAADAAGCGVVVLSGTSVDLYNPKVLRATAG